MIAGGIEDDMKVIYMGTPDFAVGALKSVIEAGHEVKLVVTQPDRVRGRGGEVSFCPVKQCALEYGLPVFQPEKIRLPEAVARLKEEDADIYIVAAFGQIMSEEILNIPRYGCINIHASLLPKYRGAAPIQWCILNGETKTGVTIMQMDKGIDTGDILLQREIDIAPDETGESLFDKLAVLGSKAVTEALTLIEKGEITPVRQDESKATHVGMLRKEMGLIDWNDTGVRIERYVRGLNSWPSAYTYHKSRMLKIWESHVDDTPGANTGDVKPGTVIKADDTGLYVQTGEGVLVITSLQIEGRKRMDTAAFLRGQQVAAGEILGR